MGTKTIFLLLVLTFHLRLSAQDSVTYLYPKITKAYFGSCFKNAFATAVSPVHWKTRQWIGFSSLAASGLLLYTQDEAIRNRLQLHRSSELDKVAKYGLEPWGSGVYSIPLIGGMYLIGRWTADDRLSSTALTSAKSACISALIVNIAKQMAHRHRPYQDEPALPDQWDGPFSNFHYSSFPSGHSTMAFSIATVFAMEYQETVWVPILAYTIATGTALSRVYNDKHWSSDVLLGSAFGYVTGRFLWKINRKMQVVPVFLFNTSSVSLIYPI